MIISIVGILVAYTIGAIPTSYVLAKLIRGVDIRGYGSGNVGATNLLRVAGKLPAILALIVDVAKGAVAVTLVAFICYRPEAGVDFAVFRVILGLAAFSGHVWPASLKFKGGKGVATSAGILLVLAPAVFGIGLLVCLITVFSTKYVSLGSILGSVSLPISAALFGMPVEIVIFCVTICFIVCYKHKPNIARLLRNEEPKIGKKSKVK